jgi:hypothetical protein
MKTTRNITIDAELAELAKSRRYQDSEFSLSKIINEFLISYFNIEQKNLKKEDVEKELEEAKKNLGLAEARKNDYEIKKKKEEEEEHKQLMEKIASEREEEFGEYNY